MTTRKEVSIENIRCLEFWDLGEGVTLRRVILWRLGCNLAMPTSDLLKSV